MKSKIITDYRGKKIDLGDAFEIFEEAFDNTEDIFDHMEKLFGAFDKDIRPKLDKLKLKLAKERPDEFDYIPESKEEAKAMMESLSKYLRKGTGRRLSHNQLFGIVITGLFILLFGVIMLLQGPKKKEPVFGAPVHNEAPLKQLNKTPETKKMREL